MPKKAVAIPIQHDITIIFRKLFVSILADIAGATIAAASNVTPIELIEAITTLAKTRENNVSIRLTLTP